MVKGKSVSPSVKLNTTATKTKAAPSIPPLPPGRPRLIRLPEVLARVGLSRSSIYNRIKEGTFPSPCRLGEKSVAWSEASIDTWIADRLDCEKVTA